MEKREKRKKKMRRPAGADPRRKRTRGQKRSFLRPQRDANERSRTSKYVAPVEMPKYYVLEPAISRWVTGCSLRSILLAGILHLLSVALGRGNRRWNRGCTSYGSELIVEILGNEQAAICVSRKFGCLAQEPSVSKLQRLWHMAHYQLVWQLKGNGMGVNVNSQSPIWITYPPQVRVLWKFTTWIPSRIP
jgi:hypothetical protein